MHPQASRSLPRTIDDSLSSNENGDGRIMLDSLRPDRYVLRVSAPKAARRLIPWPVYHFERADIDGDGREEACVGVIKPTRHDRVNRRRLFIFRYAQGAI